MDTGKVVKIVKNVPQPIPVEIPTKKTTGKPTTTPEQPLRGIPVQIPKREKVENAHLSLR